MNDLIQTILLIATLAGAVWFLVRKFVIKKPTDKPSCGSGGDCKCG